jgi:hypothetical protein
MPILRQLFWIGLGLIIQGCREQPINMMGMQSNQPMDRKMGVKYTPVGVIEDKIGLPKDLMHANRVTRIDITLAVKSFEEFKEKINAVMLGQYNLAYEKFNPAAHSHFVIRSDQLVVTDTSKEKHKLAVYLIPIDQKLDQNTLSLRYPPDFLVLTTLDGLPYSFLTKAQSHQAMFLYEPKHKPPYTPYGSKDTLTSPSELKEKTKFSKRTQYWSGVGLSIPIQDKSPNPLLLENIYEEGEGTKKITYNRVLPAVQTIYPCFQPILLPSTGCLTYGTEGKYLKARQSYPFLQPLAPIGVVSVDWHNSYLHEDKLKGYKAGDDELTDAVKAAAVNEIQEILRTTTDMNDIGWFGIPIEKRQEIDRLHYTQINFSFVEDSDLKSIAHNQLQVASIVVSEYNNVDMSLKNYAKDKKPISPQNLMDKLLKPTILSLKEDDGEDTINVKDN